MTDLPGAFQLAKGEGFPWCDGPGIPIRFRIEEPAGRTEPPRVDGTSDLRKSLTLFDSGDEEGSRQEPNGETRVRGSILLRFRQFVGDGHSRK